MNSEEKIEYVKNEILEKAKKSPKGFISIPIRSFTTQELVEMNGGVPDGAPDAMTKLDYIDIFRKLEQEHYIWLLSFDEKYTKAEFVLDNGAGDNLKKKQNSNIFLNTNENIKIKVLGIKIKENYVYCKNEKLRINNTDRKLIDYLNYRSLEEKNSCISIDRLCNHLNKKKGYVQNRISFINTIIRKMLPNADRRIIDSFIKSVPERGYQLNQRFMIEFTDKP